MLELLGRDQRKSHDLALRSCEKSRIALIECLGLEFDKLFRLVLTPCNDLPRLQPSNFSLQLLGRLGTATEDVLNR